MGIYIPSMTKPLTKRQQQIVYCLCQGMSDKETASYLDLKIRTVQDHCSDIYKRYNVRDRVSLVIKALTIKFSDGKPVTITWKLNAETEEI